MPEKFTFDEDSQWPMRILRVIFWSNVMGLIGGYPWLFLVFLNVCHYGFATDFSFLGFLFFPWFYAGLIGCYAALCAPTHETFWPSQAPTFRVVGRLAFGYVFTYSLFANILAAGSNTFQFFIPFSFDAFGLIWHFSVIFALFKTVKEHRTHKQSSQK